MHPIVWFFLALVLVIILFKVLKKIASVAISAAAITAIVFLVIAGLKYADQNDIRDNFLNSRNLFVLEDDSELITGFATLPQETYDQEYLKEVNSEIQTGKPSGFYKIIIVKKEQASELAKAIEGASVSEQGSIFEDYVQDNFLSDGFVDNLIDKEKAGEIEVKEETISFKFY